MALQLDDPTAAQHGTQWKPLGGEDQVRQGAVNYILSKATPPRDADWDANNIASDRRRWRHIHMQACITSITEDFGDKLYTIADLRAASAKLRANTGCAGLPFAVAKAPMFELEGAWTALMNLVLPTGMVAKCWQEGYIDHVHKSNKPAAMFDSYRELTRSFIEGRLFEELLGGSVLPALKKEALHFQDGLGDSLVANAASMDVHLCRKAQGLPSGDICTDKQEAFDRRRRECTLADIAEESGVHPLYLLLMSEAITKSTLRVCHEHILSNAFHLKVGIQQGKILSSAQYSVPAATAAKRINSTPGVGIGVNPTPRAVEALLYKPQTTATWTLTKSGTGDRWFIVVQCHGNKPWGQLQMIQFD